MANIRLKAALAVKKIDAPADWSWNRWLKAPGNFRKEFLLFEEDIIPIEFGNLSPPQHFLYEFILDKISSEKWKEYDKWLKSRSTKSIRFNLNSSKTNRYFIQVAVPKVTNNKIPDYTPELFIVDKYLITNESCIVDNYSQKLSEYSTLLNEGSYKSRWAVVPASIYTKLDINSTNLVGQIQNYGSSLFTEPSITNNLLADAEKVAVNDESQNAVLVLPEISNDLLPSSDVKEVSLLNVDEFYAEIIEVESIVLNVKTVHKLPENINFSNTRLQNYIKHFIIASKRKFMVIDVSLDSTDISPDFFEYSSLKYGHILKFDTSVNISVNAPLQIVNDILETKSNLLETGDFVNNPILAASEKVENLKSNYYKFQDDILSDLIKSPQAIISYETGLGKKVQVIKALKQLFKKGKVKQTVIICSDEKLDFPNKDITTCAPEGWENNFFYWAPEFSLVTLKDSLDINSPVKEQIVIISESYICSIKGQDNFKKLKPDILIFDEMIISPEQHNIINLIQASGHKYSWFLSNEDKELIEKYVTLFSTPKKSKLNYVKKTREEYHSDLPSKIKINKWFFLNKEQSIDYDSALFQGQIKIYSTIERGNLYIIRPHIFTLVHQLTQICNFSLSNLTGLKSEYLLKLLHQSNDKFVIFTQYEKYGIDPLVVILKSAGVSFLVSKSGSIDSQNKTLENFEKNKNVKVLIADSKGLNRKLNLNSQVTIIHFDQWWNPASKYQLEEKIKSSKSIIIYSFRVRNTIEEKTYSVLSKKGMCCESIFGKLPAASISDYIDTEEWMEILAINQEKTKLKSTVNLKTFSVNEMFELIKSTFAEFGYTNLKSGDNGQIENVIMLSRMLSDGEDTILIQCKMKEMVEVYDIVNYVNTLKAYRNITHSYIITPGNFSPDSRKYLHSLGDKITFLNGAQLKGLSSLRKNK